MPADGPDEPVRKTGGSSSRRPPRAKEVTRSEEVRRPSTNRSNATKSTGAAKSTPRPSASRARGATNTSTSATARRSSPARKRADDTSGNGGAPITGEQPVVPPPAEDMIGPTWAETIATLTTTDELDPDDIAILTGWAQSEAATLDAPPETVPSDTTDDWTAAVPVIEREVSEPAVVDPSAIAVPFVDVPAVDVPSTAPATASGLDPARAFTLWRRRRPRVRKVTRVVRRIDTWSVLKVSLLFYVVMFVILLIAGVLLWNLATSTGTVRNVEGFIRDLFNLEKFDVSGRELFRASWTLGAFLVVGGTGLNVTMAVLFNLISDLVGGVRVTVLEEEVVLRPRAVNVSGRPAPLVVDGDAAPAPETNGTDPAVPAEPVDAAPAPAANVPRPPGGYSSVG